MESSREIVVLALDEQRYGLWLSAVERVTRVVFVTPLPKAPDVIAGIVDVQGEILPVVDLRRRFGLPRRDVSLTDHLVLARTPRRRLALIVDCVSGIELANPDACVGVDALPRSGDCEYVAGIVKTPNGLILIHDLSTFLALEEERALDDALTGSGGLA